MHQRKWKQKLSGLMAGVMLLGTLPTAAFAWEAPTDVSWRAATEDVAARFFVGSDTHIGRTYAPEKLSNALKVFAEVDANADGVLLVGDITNEGKESQYATLMNTINASDMANKVVLAMGNHEYNSGDQARFESKTGQNANQVLYYGPDGLIELSDAAEYLADEDDLIEADDNEEIADERSSEDGQIETSVDQEAADEGFDEGSQIQTVSDEEDVETLSDEDRIQVIADELSEVGLVATVVKLSPNSSGNYTGSYDMLKEALETSDSANSKAPIIVIGHHGIKNTAYVTNEWNGNYGEGTNKDMVALMEEYSQVIHISGHSHSTLEDARSIYQDDGFTAIQDGTIGAYFENESGKIDPSTGRNETCPPNDEIASQALRIDVEEDGTVTIYRMNLTTGEYMYEDEPWAFNAAGDDMPYTMDRENESAEPFFAEDAAVEAECNASTTATVKFPAAQPASKENVDMIHEYVITFTPTNGASIVRRVFADYYVPVDEQKSEWSVKVKDLRPDTAYSVSVQAETSFGVRSDAIEAAGTIYTGEAYVAPYPAEAILDVNFARDASGVDAKGHAKNVYGEPQFVKDETLGRTVAVFDGVNDGLRYTMTGDDYKKIGTNFTIELYYMPLDTENNNPMGNTQSSGFCFEQKSGTSTLQFWAHINGAYQKPEATVTKDAWNHMVATYDGQNVTLYLNGDLISTVAAVGAMDEPPHYLFLGGDTSTDGSLEYPANCKIALARVYTGTMTDEDVGEAYQAAVEGTVTEPDEQAPVITFTEEPLATAKVSEKYALPKVNYENDNSQSRQLIILHPQGKEEKISGFWLGLTKEVTPDELGAWSFTYTTANDAGKTASAGFTVTVIDKVAPTITFEEPPAETAELNEKYTLPTVDFQNDNSRNRQLVIRHPGGEEETIPSILVTFKKEVELKEVGIWTFTYTTSNDDGQSATESFTVNVIDPSGEVTVAKADVLDVDFTDGRGEDKSATKNEVRTFGSPVIQDNEEMGKKTARFNGEYDAYLYPFDDTKYDKMSSGATIECVFRYEDVPATGEHDIFSNQQGGGIGLGLENGRLQFFCNVNKSSGGNGYVQPNAKIEAGQWYHAVGVFDGNQVRLFLNGEPVDTRDAGGTTIHWPTGGAQNFVIGGDSNSSNGPESFSNAYVSAARLYSKGMSAAEVKALYQSMEPPMIAVPSIGSLPLNKPFTVPAGTASNGNQVTVTVTDPHGKPVALTDGVFTPTEEGDYTFAYSMNGAKRVLVRPAVDMENLPINLGLVTSKTAAAGSKFNVSIHLNKNKDLTVGSEKSFDLTYDPVLVTYVGSENVMGGVTISDDKNGTLHISYTGDVSSEEFINYSATRLVRLTFSAKAAAEDNNAEFKFGEVNLATTTQKQNINGATVVLKGSTALDKNGDGIIGAGDVALAETSAEAKLIAQAAAIYPYKHVISITMDGGGICYDPDAMYYYDGSTTKLSSEPTILAKRTNDYAMKLFNEYCATSYSARSETPTISAQNYTSILHGKEYATAQAPYKIDNSKTGVYYYPDFGKDVPVYPSVFKALGESFPNRGNAAFAEWTQIVNGIIEPDAPVYLYGSTKSAGDMQDVADYIRSKEFENTAMVYMQSDEMDHIGHSYNFFSDAYYTELNKFDGYFQEIMNALEETSHMDDTLLLINSDHGGTRTGHGGVTNQEYDVEIALGGQTIDSGKRLTGGTNHDPSVLTLTALRAKVPDSMDGTASLFEQASLSQEQLVQKNRDIETITAYTGPNTKAMELKLSNVKGNIIKAADLVIDLNGRAVSSITTSGTILRQTVENGKLYLTISYSAADGTLAKVVFDGTSEGVKVEEFMLGTSNGKEIYGDLVTETVDTVDPSKPSKPDAGGSSSSGSGSNTTTTTEKNPDGSTTTTITDKKTGAVTETVKLPDGTTGTVVTDKRGNIIEVKAAVSGTAAKSGETVTLPVEVLAVSDIDDAPAVEISVPRNADGVKVEIPVEHVTPGTVAVIVDKNGNETIVKTSVPTEKGVAITLDGSATVKVVDNSKYFVDADDHWAEDGIQFVSARGMMNGTSDAAFTPDSNLTRGMIAVILHNFEDNPENAYAGSFADVAEGSWYADGIRWAAEQGIVGGYGNGKFGADDSITREQLATILYNYARVKGYDVSDRADLAGYADAASISNYAKDAMAWANATGLVNGTSGTTLSPRGNATRAQVAVILMRFCENIK